MHGSSEKRKQHTSGDLMCFSLSRLDLDIPAPIPHPPPAPRQDFPIPLQAWIDTELCGVLSNASIYRLP